MDVGNKDERDGGFIGLAGGLLALVVILVVLLSYNVLQSLPPVDMTKRSQR